MSNLTCRPANVGLVNHIRASRPSASPPIRKDRRSGPCGTYVVGMDQHVLLRPTAGDRVTRVFRVLQDRTDGAFPSAIREPGPVLLRPVHRGTRHSLPDKLVGDGPISTPSQVRREDAPHDVVRSLSSSRTRSSNPSAAFRGLGRVPASATRCPYGARPPCCLPFVDGLRVLRGPVRAGARSRSCRPTRPSASCAIGSGC